MNRPFAVALLCLSLSASLAGSLQAAEPGGEVVIRPQTDGTIWHEYRVNGEIREIKVVPDKGKPYYLVPADGGGYIRLDRSQMLIPKWVLFRW